MMPVVRLFQAKRRSAKEPIHEIESGGLSPIRGRGGVLNAERKNNDAESPWSRMKLALSFPGFAGPVLFSLFYHSFRTYL